MPQYDDDDYDDEDDDDQSPDYESAEDADDADDDDDALDTTTDEGLIQAISAIFAQKLHLQLPPDTDPRSFLRDLYAALHGHPGIELQGYDQGGADDEDAVPAQPQNAAAQMGHRRRKKSRRLSAARGSAVAAEVLRSMRRPPEGRSAMADVLAAQRRAAARLGHNVPRASREEKLRQQILREALTADGDMLR